VSSVAAPGVGSRGWPAVNPRDANAAHNAGLAALKDGSELLALPLLDAARAFHPRDPRLWQITGLLYRSLDDLAPAVSAFEKAAALAPDNALIAHGHARAALEAGIPAVYLFERAHQLAPLDGAVILGLAAALSAEHGPAASLGLIEGHLEEHPGWLPGHALLARLRCVIGDRTRLAESYERALLKAPDAVDLWRDLLITLIHAERFEDAVDASYRARRAMGDHIIFDANEAVALDEIGELERASRLFDQLAYVDDDVLFTVRRMRHSLRLDRPDLAAAMGEPLLAGPHGQVVAPYMSIAWRLLGDARWSWLEGDERLVGVYDLADQIRSLEPFAQRLRGLHNTQDQPLEQSVRGGTQTDGELLSRIEPEIRALRQLLARTVERHIAQLPPYDPAHPLLQKTWRGPVRFSGSWSIRLFDQGYHANHVHPEGWLSSAFYVALPDRKPGEAPEAGWLQLGAPQKELGSPLETVRSVEPKPGRLVLFPSTMWHGTNPFSAGERLTVAFDVARPA